MGYATSVGALRIYRIARCLYLSFSHQQMTTPTDTCIRVTREILKMIDKRSYTLA
jgi:hypothetical protein